MAFMAVRGCGPRFRVIALMAVHDDVFAVGGDPGTPGRE